MREWIAFIGAVYMWNHMWWPSVGHLLTAVCCCCICFWSWHWSWCARSSSLLMSATSVPFSSDGGTSLHTTSSHSSALHEVYVLNKKTYTKRKVECNGTWPAPQSFHIKPDVFLGRIGYLLSTCSVRNAVPGFSQLASRLHAEASLALAVLNPAPGGE